MSINNLSTAMLEPAELAHGKIELRKRVFYDCVRQLKDELNLAQLLQLLQITLNAAKAYEKQIKESGKLTEFADDLEATNITIDYINTIAGPLERISDITLMI